MSILQCLADISTWTAVHHLKLNLRKTKLLFIPGKDCPRLDLSVTVEDVTVWPLSTSRSLSNITTVAWSCRFALYNICRIWFVFTKDTTPGPSSGHLPPGLLQLPLGLLASVTKPCSISRTLQGAAFTIFPNSPMWPPLLCDLHWLPVVAHIWFKTMVLAFKDINGTAPVNL